MEWGRTEYVAQFFTQQATSKLHKTLGSERLTSLDQNKLGKKLYEFFCLGLVFAVQV